LTPDELLQALGQFPTLTIFKTNGAIPAEHTGRVSLEEYVSNYASYIEGLTGGQKLDWSVLGKLYVSLSLDATIFSSKPCSDSTRKVVHFSKPVVQVQELQAAYLTAAGKVRMNCMAMNDPIHFGLMISHHNVWNVYGADPGDPTRFPNVALIDELAAWIKAHTKPCKVTASGREQTLSVRLGRGVLRWINEHDALARRSIVVNAGRPAVVEPSWRTPTVLRLAEAVRKERAFDSLPMLGDALEEAGCNDAEVLAHCRRPRPHVRECWVVDLLLGNPWRRDRG
jgi:hypothetical protein